MMVGVIKIKCRRHNDLAISVFDAAPWCIPKEMSTNIMTYSSWSTVTQLKKIGKVLWLAHLEYLFHNTFLFWFNFGKFLMSKVQAVLRLILYW